MIFTHNGKPYFEHISTYWGELPLRRFHRINVWLRKCYGYVPEKPSYHLMGDGDVYNCGDRFVNTKSGIVYSFYGEVLLDPSKL